MGETLAQVDGMIHRLLLDDDPLEDTLRPSAASRLAAEARLHTDVAQQAIGIAYDWVLRAPHVTDVWVFLADAGGTRFVASVFRVYGQVLVWNEVPAWIIPGAQDRVAALNPPLVDLWTRYNSYEQGELPARVVVHCSPPRPQVSVDIVWDADGVHFYEWLQRLRQRGIDSAQLNTGQLERTRATAVAPVSIAMRYQSTSENTSIPPAYAHTLPTPPLSQSSRQSSIHSAQTCSTLSTPATPAASIAPPSIRTVSSLSTRPPTPPMHTPLRVEPTALAPALTPLVPKRPSSTPHPLQPEPSSSTIPTPAQRAAFLARFQPALATILRAVLAWPPDRRSVNTMWVFLAHVDGTAAVDVLMDDGVHAGMRNMCGRDPAFLRDDIGSAWLKMCDSGVPGVDHPTGIVLIVRPNEGPSLTTEMTWDQDSIDWPDAAADAVWKRSVGNGRADRAASNTQ